MKRIQFCNRRTSRSQTSAFTRLLVLVPAGFDVLLILIVTDVLLPIFLGSAPFLPKQYAQEYTPLATLTGGRETANAFALTPEIDRRTDVRREIVHPDKVRAFASTITSDGRNVTAWSWKARGGWMPPPTKREFLSVPTRQWFKNLSLSVDFRHGTTIGLDRDMGPAHPIVFLIGHAYEVNALAFSADGKTLASGGEDRELTLWDVAGGKIQLWDVHTGRLLHTLKSPGRGIRLLAFSPGGKNLASVSERPWNTILIWELESRRLLSILTGHRSRITDVAFARDSMTLVSADEEGTVCLWDITGRNLTSLTPTIHGNR